MSTSFRDLSELGERLESTTKHTLMIDAVSRFLLRLEPQEVEPAVSMLMGRAFQKWSPRTLNVSWTTLIQVIKDLTGVDWDMFSKSFSQTGDVGSAVQAMFGAGGSKKQTSLVKKDLTVREVRKAFELIAEASGPRSREKKERLARTLFSAASPTEAKYLVKILMGEMRTGFGEGLMEQAVSKAFGVPIQSVRESSMIMGDVGEIAEILKTQGKDGLLKLRFKVFRPVSLMLAKTAETVADALAEHGGKSAFEYKYDGARVQIHKKRTEVKIFSRRLTDVTNSLPDIVKTTVASVKADEAILEGEVVAVDDAGFPIPFQHLMRRFRRIHDVEDTTRDIPLMLYMFDILYLAGRSLLSTPYADRRSILLESINGMYVTKQLVTEDVTEAQRFLEDAMKAGHEGLMAKRLDSLYSPGTRGKSWLKIKPVLETLDLVITAAEYGYGRRHGWLSDYCLGARDFETGEFLVVGKTFKGLTDAEIAIMTDRLKQLIVKRDAGRVTVLPKIVVEVAYNEIQRSPKYKSKMALRFARIIRIRDDKSPEETDTVQRVREIYEKQFLKKGRYETDFN